MTLSQIIKLRTDNGLEIVDFLVEVMRDRYEDFQICHRLQAANLLTTYGNEDAPNFIDDNTADSSSNTRKRKPRRPTKFDTELARVISEDTDDGRSIARFLVNVMVGELTSFRPHHRMSAARELLDRGFGKSARAEAHVHPENASSPVVPAEAGTQWGQGREALTPHSSLHSLLRMDIPPSFRRRPEPRGGRVGKLSLLTPLHSLLNSAAETTELTGSSTGTPSALTGSTSGPKTMPYRSMSRR